MCFICCTCSLIENPILFELPHFKQISVEALDIILYDDRCIPKLTSIIILIYHIFYYNILLQTMWKRITDPSYYIYFIN